MKLLLIRHAESVGNIEERIEGWGNSQLTALGQPQAMKLANHIVGKFSSLSSVHSCNLDRVRQTTQVIARELELPLVVDKRLRRYQSGVLTRVKRSQIKTRYPEIWESWQKGHRVPIPEEEGGSAFRKRLNRVLVDIFALHLKSEKDVAIVSHGTALGMLLVIMLRVSMTGRDPLGCDNVSLSVVQFNDRVPKLVRLNDTCYLTD